MRAQAHTLEGVIAGVVLISALAFALQVTAVTPLSASTSSQHIENQQRATAEGLIQAARETGALRRAVLYWGDSDGDGTREFHDADNARHYTSQTPTNEFGRMIEDSFRDRGIAVNVHVVYLTSSGGRERQRMVYRGKPSDNAVTATTVLTLYDDDELHQDLDGDGTAEATGTAVTGSNFYAEDAASASGVYNVVVVEVTVWRQ